MSTKRTVKPAVVVAALWAASTLATAVIAAQQPGQIAGPLNTDDDGGGDDLVSLEFQVAASTNNRRHQQQQLPSPQHQNHQNNQQHEKTTLAEMEAKWKDVPDKYFIIIAHFLAGYINDTDAIDEFNGPILKSSIKSFYWVFLIQYAILAVLGVVLNIAIIAYIFYHRLYKDVTHAFIVNLALCHFVQCAVVLPITLMVMLIQNWIFGQFMCFFLPMLQDIPLHVALISHILIAWDRMRWLSDPLKGRLPAFVCCCATWLTGMVIALPYPIYTIYLEIGDFVPRLDGIGLCVVNLMDDMHEYMRGLFLIMYCGPTVLLAYLYIRTSQELRPPDGAFAVMMFEHRANIRNRQRNSSNSSADRSTTYNGSGTVVTTTTSGFGSAFTSSTNGGGSAAVGSATGTASATASSGLAASTSRSYDLYSAELDVHREKRNQRNFGTMAATQVVCLCPLMILRFARLSMEETYENQKHFDFTYLMFVWVAFLPTVIFPCIYALQILPRTEQERLRGYFRLSAKKKSRNCVGRGGSTDTPSSRENSIEKDDNTNTTQATSIIPGHDGYISGHTATVADVVGTTKIPPSLEGHKYPLHYNNRKHGKEKLKSSNPAAVERHGSRSSGGGGGGGSAKTMAGSEGKHRSKSDGRLKRNDVKITVISEGGPGSKLKSSAAAATVGSVSSGSGVNGYRKQSTNSTISAGSASMLNAQRKHTLESLDNNSCSNMTSSTYCNGNGNANLALLDDGGTSHFGDGEDSSIASGMIVSGNGNMPGYYDKKWTLSGLRQKDVSFSDSGSFSRMDSSSTLARDMEIIDLLERERSMDIQEMLDREQQGEPIRLHSAGERRRLPDIEKICQRSPKPKLNPYTFEKTATTASSLSAKDMTQGTTASLLSSASSDPLQYNRGPYSASSSYGENELMASRDDEITTTTALDEEVPQDFFDNFTPGGEEMLPAVMSSGMAGSSASASAAAAAAAAVAAQVAAPPYQYQYSRRLSRKSSHHSQGSQGSHRNMSKRDSFNSLSGSDLIAGAFGELDPTQPLTKMSVIENRMRTRSGGGRQSSFSSSSARSSMKSRDYNNGSPHSGHPELDFRENIFAEL